MKTFITACLTIAGLVSLSACSSMGGSDGNSSHMTNNAPVSQVAFPDTSVTSTQTTPIPNAAGTAPAPETPPK